MQLSGKEWVVASALELASALPAKPVQTLSTQLKFVVPLSV